MSQTLHGDCDARLAREALRNSGSAVLPRLNSQTNAVPRTNLRGFEVRFGRRESRKALVAPGAAEEFAGLNGSVFGAWQPKGAESQG